jgi:hypothetical protein
MVSLLFRECYPVSELIRVDLAADYQDMAAAYQTLGYLESGITEPLNRFAEKMLDFSALLKHTVSRPSFFSSVRETFWRQPSSALCPRY